MDSIDDVKLHKEIDLIQSCIARMASNSFFIKGWTLSLVAVVLTLFDKKDSASTLALILVFPVIGFWYLDAFFLRTERCYRLMYEWVLEKRRNGVSEYLYDLNPKRFSDSVECICKVMRSNTLVCFYGVPLACLIVYAISGKCS